MDFRIGKIVMALCVIVPFTGGCDVEDHDIVMVEDVAGEGANVIDISADSAVTASLVVSRSSSSGNTGWSTGDQLGLHCTSGGVAYPNVCYDYADSDLFISYEEDHMYFNDEEEVVFTAYYPYSSSFDGVSESANQSKTYRLVDQSDWSDCDILWGQGAASKSSPLLEIAMGHIMSKVVLRIKCGDDVDIDALSAWDVWFSPFWGSATLSQTMSTYSVSGSGTEYVYGASGYGSSYSEALSLSELGLTGAIYETAGYVEYKLLVPPVDPSPQDSYMIYIDGDMSVMSASIDLSTVNSDGSSSLQGGTEYVVNITLNRGSISVDSTTIGVWSSGSSGSYSIE